MKVRKKLVPFVHVKKQKFIAAATLYLSGFFVSERGMKYYPIILPVFITRNPISIR